MVVISSNMALSTGLPHNMAGPNMNDQERVRGNKSVWEKTSLNRSCSLCNLISEVRSHHFCHTPFIKRVDKSSPCSRGGEYTKTWILKGGGSLGAILEAGYHAGFTEKVELEVVILEFFRSISGGRHSRQRKGYVKDIEVSSYKFISVISTGILASLWKKEMYKDIHRSMIILVC